MAASKADQTLLVTGANGFIAQHIIRIALERGYSVRGTGRSAATLDKLRSTFPAHADRISFALVGNLADPDAYSEAFKGATVTGVIHTASPFVLKPQDNVADILDPAVKGSVAVLDAIDRYAGGTVRRVVVTSSFASIFDFLAGYRPGYTYTEADWNPMTFDEAAAADGVTCYCASKGLAERAMWDWIAARKPAFALTALCPPWVFGPGVAAPALGRLNESTHAIWALVDADKVPAPDFCGFVDVRTIAEAHVLAYESEAAAGERFLVGSHFDYQDAVAHLRRDLPELAGRLPPDRDLVDSYALDGSKAERVLGVKYIPLRDTMRDTVVQLLEAEKAEKAAKAATAAA